MTFIRRFNSKEERARMIHHNSTDPVLIKKITLRIWTLRDEVEAVIEQKKVANGDVTIDEIAQEYKKLEAIQSENNDNVIDLNASVADTSGEDEMAKAMAEAEGDSEAQETSEEGADEADSQSETEETNSDGNIIVLQRHPRIPEDKLIHGKTILQEVDMEHMFFFSDKRFLEGQSIVIEFLIPKRFVVNAEVLYSRQYNRKSRVISEKKLSFRNAVRFTFLKTGERTLLRQFIQSVEADIPEPIKVKPKAKQEEADEFDDLDDLDL